MPLHEDIEFENVQGQRYFVQERLLYGEIEILNFGPLSPPSRSKLWAAWQQFNKVRKRERATEATALDEHEWVDGR